MTTLAAIETNYAGCRFRSRLEARWAVFFDHLGVEWQYEPQGYTVGPDATRYLPDFWLPEMQLWVEVKGQLEHEGLQTLIYAASEVGLPLSPDGKKALGLLWPWHPRILLLGQIPDPGRAWLHSRIDVVAHDLVVVQACSFVWWGDKPVAMELFEWDPLNRFLAGENSEAGYRKRVVNGFWTSLLVSQPRIADAYRAARSARFEHGESGAS